MITTKTLPLTIRETPPDPSAEKIAPGSRPDGLPDGVHTGGVWRFAGAIWKPLDGRAWMNADCHVPTREADFLEAVADLASFPRNWRVEERNGRRWLVRPEVYVLNPADYRLVNRETILRVEADVREANRRTWEIGDAIILAYDDNHGYFVLDCSTAGQMKGSGAYEADDCDRITKFFALCGEEALLRLRNNGKFAVCSPLDFEDKHGEEIERQGWGRSWDFRHVYASFNRPLSRLWASFAQPVILEQQAANWRDGIPHTWVISNAPLPEDVCRRYELTWAWSPIH